MKNQKMQMNQRHYKKGKVVKIITSLIMVLSLLFNTGGTFANIYAMEHINTESENVTNNDVNPATEQFMISTNLALNRIWSESKYRERNHESKRALYNDTQKIHETRIIEQTEIVCDPTNITRVSGMNIEQMKVAFKGTWLEGQEDVLVRFEQEYGVNVFFLYAVSTWESGHGKFINADRAKAAQNYYGINLKRKWADFEDNTMFWGGMMNRVYINKGYVDVNVISPIYCPPNPNYSKKISETMVSIFNNYTANTTVLVEL